jgi:hypothetical protein
VIFEEIIQAVSVCGALGETPHRRDNFVVCNFQRQPTFTGGYKTDNSDDGERRSG